jgi:hypothetical protein
MKSYQVATAEFITLENTKQPDGSMVATNKSCQLVFVEVVNNNTTKQLDGSSERSLKAVTVRTYNGICKVIRPNTNMVINGVVYGNLEVVNLPDSKLKVEIRGWS